MKTCRLWVAISAAGMVSWAMPAWALINPRFTPIHLVKQAKLIFEAELKQGDSKDLVLAKVQTAIKGKMDAKVVRLDLARAITPEQAEAVRQLIKGAGGSTGLFFVGDLREEGQGDGADESVSLAMLHICGRWVEFQGSDPKDAWKLTRINSQMEAVWAGGTDMLRRAVDYILTDPDPDVPVAAGSFWAEKSVQIGTLKGRIAAVQPVDLDGDGRLLLFAACEQGDRLWACDKTRRFTDLTAKRGLRSRSLAWAWGDFNGDGRLDLASYDGQTLCIHAQAADGTFAPRPLELPGAPEKGCLALAALDCGRQGCSGLLISTGGPPSVVALESTGKATVVTLTAPGVDLAKLGKPGACLVADFDGDTLPDVLQPAVAGSVLYRGTALGTFAAGAACALHVGPAPNHACLADFDGDGRLDVFTVATDGTRIWENRGDGKFVDYLGTSGEIAYISKPGGIACGIGDINNDGRQDALIAYGALAPHIFFNRGYRSFGHAHTLDLAERRLLAADQGQQAACLADFDGDGTQEMVIALTNGDLHAFFQEDGGGLAAVVALPLTGDYKGPLAVIGWSGKRCLGAWSVLPGSPAFFGCRHPGPVTLRWTLPGGKPQEKEVIVEERPVRFEVRQQPTRP